MPQGHTAESFPGGLVGGIPPCHAAVSCNVHGGARTIPIAHVDALDFAISLSITVADEFAVLEGSIELTVGRTGK